MYADSIQSVCRQYAGSKQEVNRQCSDSILVVTKQYSGSTQAIYIYAV
jgi:hypothetical protein